uniref:Cytochrome c oxidase subunit 3 n=1 Tax=Amaga expatria TaxID=2744267 RepID=A0A899L6R3_9PLAT|nr:cytochrome c oxidase subunit III [Amaga expatria]QSM34660.1 cytochrome c oxidase subunit 3 [Amaga expatria]
MYSCFHLVNNSPWPLFLSLSIMNFLFSNVFWWHYNFIYLFFMNFFVLILVMFFWLNDVDSESFFGLHTGMVVNGLRIGIILFIVSEVCFFFSFFWSFFHNCWSPSILIYSWPPCNLSNFIIDPFGLPLLNTILLLSSGVSITMCHHNIFFQNAIMTNISFLLTILYGLIFLFVQFSEYQLSNISINSTIYGSVFFLLTGFHGLHVIVGLVMISYSFFRFFLNLTVSSNHMVGFEVAAWYWHFVDVVWLFLYIFLYWYGYNMI